MGSLSNYFGFLFTANAIITIALCACLPEGSVEAAGDGLGLPQLPALPGLEGLGLGQVGQQVGGAAGGLPDLGGLGGLGGSAKACKCDMKFEPVCASNGKTFNNECLFRCEMKKEKKAKGGKVHGKILLSCKV